MENSVAIIGIACRFPGSDDPHEFLETLVNGKNHVTVIPEDRWNVGSFYEDNADSLGKMYTNRGAFLNGVYEWDNVAFGINKYEAERMDPQQKLALEVTYRAFENAGLTEDKTKGSKTAVYMGQMNHDFSKIGEMDVLTIDNFTASGTSSCILSNRMSYAFDLRGPSVTLDTACSSSLVGVHLGAKSIVSGESEMAVCGGVNLMLSPATFIALSKAGMASKIGQCQPFSADADGYTRGEGCGIVILKSVKKALEDKNRIWGYISTGCNSDGRSCNPITNPSSESQQSLIMQTFQEANIPQHSVQYVEMHGTGTPVGDPAEALAVGETIGKARQLKQYTPVMIGSVKSNIGHLESSAGVAGLIKVLLMMHHGQYTTSLFSSSLNPAINFHRLGLEVVRQAQDWPLINKERVAALNSFGFGGTNIHAIVKYASMNETIEPQNMPLLIVAFSGKTKKSVRKSMKDTLDGLRKGYITNIYDTAYTSFNLRNHYLFRKAVLIQPSMGNFIEQLENLVKDDEPAITKLKSSSKTNTIFVLCGMGTHWDKMGKEFYETVPIFKETIDTIDKQFYLLSGFKIQECLFGHKDLNNPVYGQPAIFGVQVGLVEMWRYFGVMPDFVLGHSVGEVAAAYASNSLCLKSAVKVIFHRSRLLMNMQGGSMLVVGNVLVSTVEKYIDESGFKNDICIAAYNSPKSCTVSGKSEVLSKLENILKMKLTDTNVFLRKLPVEVAYHSHYMDPVLNEIRRSLVKLLPGMDPIKHISTVTGDMTEHKTFCTGDYWARNVRDSVLFDKAFRKTLDNNSQNIVIEIGPKPALKSYINEISNRHNCKVLASMTVGKCNDMFFKGLGEFYESGGQIMYANLGNVETYPQYGFDKNKLFEERPKAQAFLHDVNAIDSINHPFIAKNVTNISEDMVTIANITKETAPFVYDHIVGGIAIMPGAAYVEMAATSVLIQRPDTYKQGKHLVVKINFNKPCIVTSKQHIKTTIFLESNANSEQMEFDCTTPDNLHASGVVVLQDNRMYNAKQHNIASIKSRCKDKFDASDLYCQMKKLNFSHGPLLQSVKFGQRNKLEIFADVEIDDEKYENYLMHPVLLDCLMQLCCMFPAASHLRNIGQVIPFGIEEVTIERKPPRIVHVYLHMRKSSDTMILIDADAMDKAGNTLLQCKGIKIGAIGSESNLNIKETMFNLFWMDVTVEKSKNPGAGKIFTLSCLDRNSLKGINSTELAENMHVIENDPFEWNIKNTVSSNNMEQFTHVMFILGKSYLNESSTGEFVSETIARICFSLLEFVRFILSTHPHISVTVVTTQVYNNLENDENTMHSKYENLDGLIGYSIWGMLRTIRHEFPFQKIKAIDIDNYDTNCWHTVQNILTQNMPYNEMVVTAGKIKTCHFSYVQDVTEKKRVIKIQEECGVAMHYGKQNCGEYHDLMFQPIGNIDCSENTMLINGRKLFILHPGRINIPRKTSSKPLICSVGGTVVHKAEMFHLIQLIPVKSKIHAHPECMLPFDVFPFDTPLASIWFLAWLLCNLLKGSQSRILSTNKKDVWHNTFEQMMKIMKIYTDEVDGNGLIIIANNTADVEFLVDEYRGKSLQSIIILTWNIELKLKMHHYLDDQDINNPVKVFTVQEMLTVSDVLYSNVKLFCKWLRQIGKKTIDNAMTDIICNTEDLSVNYLHNLNVDSKIQGNSVLIIDDPQNQNFPITIGKNSIYQKRGTYLIFGGSKGLGWEMVKHMAIYGAGCVGVISRNGISDEKAVEVCELMRTYDCDIIDMKADAVCESDVQVILKGLRNVFSDKPLRGVFVGTVALNDALIRNMTLEKFQCVLQPKVAAVWNIHQSVSDLNLDFFVTQSSIASMFGNPGQSNYGAANAFLDAFSCYRRRKYGTGQTICWGALDLGILDDQARKKIVANLGILPLSKVQILESLDDCLMHNHKMICYAKFNWAQFLKRASGNKNLIETMQPLLRRKCHYIQYIAQDIHAKMKQDVNNKTEYVFKLLREVLMLDDDEIDMTQSIANLGADSLQTTTIYSYLLQTYGEIPTLSAIAFPTMSIKDLCILVEAGAKSPTKDRIDDSADKIDDDDSLNKDSYYDESTGEDALESKTNEHVLQIEVEVKMNGAGRNNIERKIVYLRKSADNSEIMDFSIPSQHMGVTHGRRSEHTLLTQYKESQKRKTPDKEYVKDLKIRKSNEF